MYHYLGVVLFLLQMTGLARKSVIERYIASKPVHSFEHVLAIKIKEHHDANNTRKTMKKLDITAFKCEFYKRWKKA